LPFPEWHETLQAVWICSHIATAITAFGYFATRTRTVSGWLGATIGGTLAGLGITAYFLLPAITSSINGGSGSGWGLLSMAIMAASSLLVVGLLIPIGWKTAKIVNLPGWFGAVMAVLAMGPGLLVVGIIGQLLYRHRLRKKRALERWREETPETVFRPYGHQPPAPSELI